MSPPAPTALSRAAGLAGRLFGARRGFGGFVTERPNARHAVELFAGEWASKLPPPYDGLPAGEAELFDDARIKWALEHLGGVDGQDVLELGPLEGGHTAMLHAAGAASITAVEANSGAYLRCLVVKEILGLERARFALGDVTEYLRGSDQEFDTGVACGVLYHLADPVTTLHLLARRCRRLFLWTHYFDAERVAAHPTLRRRITTSEAVEREGFAHTLHRHDYGRTVGGTAFWGGNQGHANWLSREDLLGAVAHAGWRVGEIGFDEPGNVNGPALALVATRDG